MLKRREVFLKEDLTQLTNSLSFFENDDENQAEEIDLEK